MGYSTRTERTKSGKFAARIMTGAYGQGHTVHLTNEFDTAPAAYAAADAWKKTQAAANKTAKEEKDAARMTCQICGKLHLANTGKLAHHGYERPGMGWQTASCSGARELPFEVSRDRLGVHIEAMQDLAVRKMEARDAIKVETQGFMAYYTSDKKNNRGRSIEEAVAVTRATWENVKATVGPAFTRHGRNASFDEKKKQVVAQITSELNHTNSYIRQQTHRFDAWKQTHTHFDSIKERWINA